MNTVRNLWAATTLMFFLLFGWVAAMLVASFIVGSHAAAVGTLLWIAAVTGIARSSWKQAHERALARDRNNAQMIENLAREQATAPMWTDTNIIRNL